MPNILESTLMRLVGRRVEDAEEKEDAEKKKEKAKAALDAVAPDAGRAVDAIRKRKKAIDDI